MNNPADTLAALAPCPFCGGADIRLHNTHTPKFSVECEDCGAEAQGEYFPFRGNKEKALFSYEHDSEPGIQFQTGDISKMPAAYRKAAASAIAAWNRRASLKGEAEPVAWIGTAARRDLASKGHAVVYAQTNPAADDNERPLIYGDTTPPPQQADLSVPPYLDPAWGGASDMGQGDDDAPATQPQQGGGEAAHWKSITDRLKEEVDGYEFRGDEGDYTPNERERMLLLDFAMGLPDELFATPPAQQPGEVGEDMIERAKAAAMAIKHNKEPWFPMTDRRLKAAIRAALAPKEKGNG